MNRAARAPSRNRPPAPRAGGFVDTRRAGDRRGRARRRWNGACNPCRA
jgi:hypothetical protein